MSMLQSQKKIVFIHPDLRGGGAEKVLVNLINSLDTVKYNISLITFFEEGVNKELLKPHITHSYVFKKVFKGWSIFQRLFPTKFLYKKLVTNDADLVVGYLEGVPTRVLGGSTNPKTKLVSWIHVDLTDFNIEKVFRGKSEMEKIYLKLDAVVGVSQTALKSITKKIDIPKDKQYVIHNVVDTSLIIEQGKEKVEDIQFSEQVVNLCSVGRLTNQKGYSRLISIIAKLKQINLPVHLYLLGSGELEKELKDLVESYKLQNHITFLGFNKNPHKYVQKCDLFVCSSYQEGFSTAVTESVILGTPVVTTNCAGMEEILDNGDIGMITDNNEDALFNGLKKVIEDQSLIGHYKRKTLEKSAYLTQKNNAKDVENLFDKLLALN